MLAPAPPPPSGEAISAAEVRFTRIVRRIGLIGGPLLALLAWWASRGGAAPAALPGLMTWCAVWWITEAIPPGATALLAAAGAVLVGVASPREAFGAFGSPILFLFVGSFFIAEAMKVHGLGARVARTLASVARGRLSMLMGLSFAAFAMSLWMSNAAATALCLPIAATVAVGVGDRRYGAALVLAIAYGASVGGIGTPVGTPPNLIGIQALARAGHEIGFLQWMGMGLPLGTLMLLAMWLVLSLVFGIRPGQPLGFAGADAATDATGATPPWSRGEIAVVIAFAFAIVGWLLPGVMVIAAPDAAATIWAKSHLTEEIVALLAGCALFLIPVGTRAAPRAALTWEEAVRIDWGVILLFGGGMLLGDLAGKTGLSQQWGNALVDLTGADSLWPLIALVTAASIILSELTSNTATATLMVPLSISLGQSAGVPVIPLALGATLGASFGFMLPISTAPNAMAFGTGRVTVRQMARAGIWFDILGYLVILGGLRLLAPLFGWT